MMLMPKIDTSRLYLLCRQTYLDVVGRGLIYSQKLFFFCSQTLMLNYLWVIHPIHLNAIQSIELNINYNHALALNTQAFDKLAECRSLKNLFINIKVSPALCRTRRGTLGYGFTYLLPTHLLTKLTSWESIRALRDLWTFKLQIECCVLGKDCWKLVRDIENDIREAIVAKPMLGVESEVYDGLYGRYNEINPNQNRTLSPVDVADGDL
jgi:hypothetical protein